MPLKCLFTKYNFRTYLLASFYLDVLATTTAASDARLKLKYR